MRPCRLAAALVLGTLLSSLSPAAAGAQTITVSITSDTVANDGKCSLREAVGSANANTPSGVAVGECPAGNSTQADTIVLAATDYALAGAPAEDANASGDLDVQDASTGGLSIQGVGSSQTTIIGAAGDRVIDLLGGGLTLRDLAVSGGNVAGVGGGVDEHTGSSNLLTLDNISVSGNHATGDGGGVYANSGLSVNGSSFDTNTSGGASGGGALYVSGSSPAPVSSSTFTANGATAAEGGGIFVATGGLTLSGSTISSNHADLARGGGIGAGVSGGPVSVSDSYLAGNTAQIAGGGLSMLDPAHPLSLTSTSITGNSLTAPAGATTLEGAGLLSRSPSNTIASTTVSGNIEHQNGGNDSGEGAGITLFDNASAATTVIRSSTISGNGAPSSGFNVFGGGLWNEQSVGASETKIVNSTISGNQATTGGGIWNQAGAVQLVQDTLGGDTAAPTGQEVFVNGPGPTLSSHASIIDATTSACAGGSPVTSLDYNLERGSGCAGLNGANDLHNTDPQLGSLSLNGGSSPTMALPATSPAIDRIPAASCTDESGSPLGVDQRGQPRPAGAACDVGAYEFQPPVPESPPSLPTSSGSNTKCYGKKVTILGTGSSEVLVGTAGNDVIASMGGADRINAGPGNDIVCGGPGNDRIRGGGGNDTLLGQGGRDTLIGGGGNDLLNAGAGRREICNGGGGRDIAKGCESKRHVP